VPVLHDGVKELVAVEERSVAIGHRQAVAVAIEGDAEIGLVLEHGLGESLGRGRADAVVDVGAVGGAADRHHLGAQLLEEANAHAVVGPVRAVDHQLQVAHREALGERALAEFEVAALGIVHALGLAEVG
jgi:hypothetical protein